MMHSLYGSLGMAPDQLAVAAAALSADPLTASKDTTFTKIFVGGLPYHTDDKTLREYFEQFGEIEEAVVITDRQTQKSRGYGFVTMKDRAATERACRDPNPIIDGRKANVNLAYLGAKPRGNAALAAAAGLQLPYQATGLAPFLQGRVAGLPQLYYSSASPLMSSPTTAGAGTAGLMLPGALSPNAAQYLDYSALTAGAATLAANNNAAAAAAAAQYAAAAAAAYPAVSAANAITAATTASNAAVTGGGGSVYEQYAYSPTYGVIPAAYAAQLGIPVAQLNPQTAAAALAAQSAAVAAQQQVDVAQSRVVQ